MFKYVLSLTFVLAFASAATISTSAMCDGVTTVGTTSASCIDGSGSFASAMVTTGSMFGAEAQASTIFSGSASASANFSGDLFFTVFGGTGQGSFYPCFVGGGNHTAMEHGMFDGVSFDADGSAVITSNCDGTAADLFPLSKPLTLGASQTVPFQLAASALARFPFFSVGASLSFARIIVFDASGNVVPNATYTLVSVPEPSGLSLTGIGLILFLAVPICRVRFRRFHRRDLR